LEIAWQILSWPERGLQVSARTIAKPTIDRKWKSGNRTGGTSQSRRGDRRSREARAIPTAGTSYREFNSRLRVGSRLHSPHAYRYEWFSSEARLCHASLLGLLDVAVDIDVIVLVLDWACRRFPASTFWSNHAGYSPGLATVFSRHSQRSAGARVDS
jgi:hypothetical protein